MTLMNRNEEPPQVKGIWEAKARNTQAKLGTSHLGDLLNSPPRARSNSSLSLKTQVWP